MLGRGFTISAVFAAALIVPTAAAAATYTVDPTALAGCNASKVCKSISDANAAVADGDTVNIKPGTYKEPDSVTVTKLNVTFTGAPGAVIVTTASAAKGKAVFVLANGTKLSGLTIGAQENGGQAVLVKGADTAVTGCFLGRIVSNDQNAPVYQVDSTVASGTNTIASTFVLQAPVASPTNIGPPAIMGNATSSLALVDDNVFSDAKLGHALELRGGTANSIIRSSLYASNPAADALSFVSAAASTTAKALTLDSVLLAGGQNAAGLRATAAAGSALAGAPGGAITVTGVHVTIAGAQNPAVLFSGTDILAGDSGQVNVTLDRSIAHGKAASGTTARTKLTMSNSDVTDKASATIVMAGNQTSTDDALFANAAKRDFHLRVDSPAIDKAGDITTGGSDKDFDLEPRKVGAATDMGADEFLNKVPHAAFAASKTTARQNEQVSFDAAKSFDPEGKSGGGITAYRWDFGDGQTTETTTPKAQHTYAEIGNYEAKLTVVDNLGAASTPAGVGMTITDGVPPAVKVASPKAGQKIHLYTTSKAGRRARQAATFAGTATDANGVRTVEVSLRRISRTATGRSAKASCTYYDPAKQKFIKRSCAKPLFFFVGFKDGLFRYKTKRAAPILAGSYELAVRATDGSGVISPPVAVAFSFVP